MSDSIFFFFFFNASLIEVLYLSKRKFVLIQTLSAAGVKTIPGNLCPNFKVFMSPCLASLRPEHLRGSHCSKSHIATVYGISGSSSARKIVNRLLLKLCSTIKNRYFKNISLIQRFGEVRTLKLLH